MTEGHSHHGEVAGGAARRALWLALGANAAFLVVEVVAGLVFDSLALLADATHMLTDVVGLGIALIAQALVLRPATARRTYGLRRAEALGGLFNGLLVLVAAVWIFVEAGQRVGDPAEVGGVGLLVVAFFGLLVNVGSAILLRRAQGRDLNMRGAYVHMAADAAGSVGAVLAGIGVLAFDADWLDPAVSIVIGLLVVWSAWGLLRDTLNVVLEGVPRHVDLVELEQAITTDPQVEAVHHLHVWELGAEQTALSAHVVLRNAPTLHDAQHQGDALKTMLAERFGVNHATLELECHVCDTADHDHEHEPRS